MYESVGLAPTVSSSTVIQSPVSLTDAPNSGGRSSQMPHSSYPSSDALEFRPSARSQSSSSSTSGDSVDSNALVRTMRRKPSVIAEEERIEGEYHSRAGSDAFARANRNSIISLNDRSRFIGTSPSADVADDLTPQIKQLGLFPTGNAAGEADQLEEGEILESPRQGDTRIQQQSQSHQQRKKMGHRRRSSRSSLLLPEKDHPSPRRQSFPHNAASASSKSLSRGSSGQRSREGSGEMPTRPSGTSSRAVDSPRMVRTSSSEAESVSGSAASNRDGTRSAKDPLRRSVGNLRSTSPGSPQSTTSSRRSNSQSRNETPGSATSTSGRYYSSHHHGVRHSISTLDFASSASRDDAVGSTNMGRSRTAQQSSRPKTSISTLDMYGTAQRDRESAHQPPAPGVNQRHQRMFSEQSDPADSPVRRSLVPRRSNTSMSAYRDAGRESTVGYARSPAERRNERGLVNDYSGDDRLEGRTANAGADGHTLGDEPNYHDSPVSTTSGGSRPSIPDQLVQQHQNYRSTYSPRSSGGTRPAIHDRTDSHATATAANTSQTLSRPSRTPSVVSRLSKESASDRRTRDIRSATPEVEGQRRYKTSAESLTAPPLSARTASRLGTPVGEGSHSIRMSTSRSTMTLRDRSKEVERSYSRASHVERSRTSMEESPGDVLGRVRARTLSLQDEKAAPHSAARPSTAMSSRRHERADGT